MNVFSQLKGTCFLVNKFLPEYLNIARFSVCGSNYSSRTNDLKIKAEFKKVEKEPHSLQYDKPKLKFLAQGVDLNKYTHKPIPYPKTGGRTWSGRVCNRRVGGGAKQMYRMVDFTRNAVSPTEPLVEKVVKVRYCPLRTADIALVANGNHKRWVLATENIKEGDLIKSHSEIPKLPVTPKVGDAHPVGALPIGTVIHNIEKYPQQGGFIARAAGCSGTVIGKQEDSFIVKMPSGREMSVHKACMATVGRASNVNQVNEIIGHPKRSRWFGIRPRSGLYHKKTGYNGRKIKPQKPTVTYDKKTPKLHEMFDV